MIDMKISIPTAAAFVIVGILASGFTTIWLWPASLIGIGISVLLFSFDLKWPALILLAASVIILIVAVVFYSGWLLQ